MIALAGLFFFMPKASAPPAQADEDFPGRDEPFTSIDIFRYPALQSYVTSTNDTEGGRKPNLPIIGTDKALLEQPLEVPSDWESDVCGLGLRYGKITGDYEADIVLDLAKSRLETAPRKESSSQLTLTVRTLWGDYHEGELSITYTPGSKDHPGGVLWTSPGSSRKIPVPRAAKKIRFRFTRRADTLTAYAAFDEGMSRKLATWTSRPISGPTRGLNIGAWSLRPEGYPAPKAYKPSSRHRYAVTSFHLTCVDALGCMIRFRD